MYCIGHNPFTPSPMNLVYTSTRRLCIAAIALTALGDLSACRGRHDSGTAGATASSSMTAASPGTETSKSTAANSTRTTSIGTTTSTGTEGADLIAEGATAHPAIDTTLGVLAKLVPGATVSIQSTANVASLTADDAGATPLIANRTAVDLWEKFQAADASGGNIALKSLSSNRSTK